MIPIYDEFPQKEISEREKHFQEEVSAFMECDCKMAYVDIDENVTISRNRDIYKRILRKMRIFLQDYYGGRLSYSCSHSNG